MHYQNLHNQIILPCDPKYDLLRQLFNRSIQKYPAAIIYCENKNDVVDAILFARKHDFRVRIRSGGHNYEGFCIDNDVLVIDTSLLKDREINENGHTVRIGSGINNREFYEFLGEYGYPFPSGTCPTVGAAGLTQGGGWGHSARLFGLACDHLSEAEIVDAKGTMITANHHSHQDLFWALRGGGGGNFGVVLSLKYDLTPKLFNVTYVDIRYSHVDEKLSERFLDVWQQWLHTADNRFTPNSRIFNSAEDGMGIFLRGFYYGDQSESEDAVQQFLEIDNAEATFKNVSFLEATRIDASFYPSFERFNFAGRFVYREFNKRQIEQIVGLVKSRASGSTYASVALYTLGGRVGDKEPEETAFFYRDATYIIGIETVWECPEAKHANLAWLLPRFKILKPLTNGSYINFPYLHTENYMEAYYGRNADRLIAVKRRYDPYNLFCFPQSISL